MGDRERVELLFVYPEHVQDRKMSGWIAERLMLVLAGELDQDAGHRLQGSGGR